MRIIQTAAMTITATTAMVYDPSEPAKKVIQPVDLPASRTPVGDHAEHEQVQEKRLNRLRNKRSADASRVQPEIVMSKTIHFRSK